MSTSSEKRATPALPLMTGRPSLGSGWRYVKCASCVAVRVSSSVPFGASIAFEVPVITSATTKGPVRLRDLFWTWRAAMATG